MRWSYLFKHWFTTVVLGTVLWLFFITSESTPFYAWKSIELYLILILPITVLSFPTYTILAFIFHYLEELEIGIKKVKAILISSTILGIIITQLISTGGVSLDLTTCYSVIAIIFGLIFKLKKKEKLNNNEQFPTKNIS